MNNNSKTFKTNTSLLFYFLKGSKRYFFLAVFFASLLSILDLVRPQVISFTVDYLLTDIRPELNSIKQYLVNLAGGVDYLKNNLWIMALIIIIAAITSAIFRFFFRYFNSKGAETLVKRMRDRLFNHILHLPFKWHSENHTGDIIQRCTSDVEQIKMFLSNQVTTLFRVAILVIFALIFMFRMNWKLTLVSAIFIPIIISYSFFFYKRMGDTFEKVDSEEGRLSAIAQENLTGVRVVRAFGREAYERERFEKQNVLYTNHWIRLMRLLSAFWSTGDIISQAQVISVMSYGVYLCVTGEITAGEYIAFVSYNNMLGWPVRMLGRVISDLSKVGISIGRLAYIMNSQEEKDLYETSKPDLLQDIEFKNVSYSYENGNSETLHDINLKIKGGSTIGILGSTGSGKSTLMYLLDRLYELPEGSGQITIGGIDIKNIDMSYLRENIGMVLQEPYLFSRTLFENIRIANQNANLEDVRSVAKIASLDDSISKFQEGYETFVGERGVTLSGGQKQRAVIAQMLLRKPPIMIFDDSLSAVDAETDHKIRSALNESAKDTTTILITHRVTTIMNADYIVVMDKGRIIEAGSHEQLLKLNGTYSKIYDLQLSHGLQLGEV